MANKFKKENAIFGKSKERIGFLERIVIIKAVDMKEIAECVKVIRDSFSTVANEFGLTAENAPRFTAFATTEGTPELAFNRGT